MSMIDISTNATDQWLTKLDVIKGITIQVGGTFVGTITLQRRPAASFGFNHPWVTVETYTAPTIRTGDENGKADYRLGLSLSADHTSGTMNCCLQSANQSGFLR